MNIHELCKLLIYKIPMTHSLLFDAEGTKFGEREGELRRYHSKTIISDDRYFYYASRKRYSCHFFLPDMMLL